MVYKLEWKLNKKVHEMTIETPNVPAKVSVAPRSFPAPPDLKGQVAIVTGGSSGIGKACALALGAAGCKVVVDFVASGLADANAVVDEIVKAGGTAIAVQCDVSNETETINLFAKTVKAFGTVDILVNNAGLQRDAQVAAMTLQQWNTVIGINLTGQFLCAREAVKEFRRRGPKPDVSAALGKIICMSSVHEVIPWGGHVNYATSKGGINMMSKSLAQELAPERIRVNTVCPGATRTPINTAAWDTPEALAQLLKLIPYGRIGEPDDIARAVLWLASDQSDYVTGISLFVDGGMTLYPGFATGG